MIRKYWIIFLVIIIAIASFWAFSLASFWVERDAHIAIKNSLVEHPEFIPKASDIHMISAGHDGLLADFYWLSAIQYIGSNAIGSEYKKYLASILNLVTDLSPKFYYPYQIGLLLLPDTNERYDKISKEDQDKHIQEAVNLGKKAIERSCDPKKIEKIKQETNLSKLYSDDAYKNPCADSMIPYYLGYVYYWGLHNPSEASQYYKIASANTDSVSGAKVMAAIMQGKGGDRQKAILMFLSLAQSQSKEKQSDCEKFAKELGDVLLQWFTSGAAPSAEFIKKVEQIRKEITHSLGETDISVDKNPIDFDNYCSTPLNKAVRELNLYYISEADKVYFAKNQEHAVNAKVLFEKGYISYLPIDFQTTDGKINIIYQFDGEVGQWDYKTGEY